MKTSAASTATSRIPREKRRALACAPRVFEPQAQFPDFVIRLIATGPPRMLMCNHRDIHHAPAHDLCLRSRQMAAESTTETQLLPIVIDNETTAATIERGFIQEGIA
jgi:hypothetical protein